MITTTSPVSVGKSEVRCPCCPTGTMVYWRREKRSGGRNYPVEWLACDVCGAGTADVIVRADGPYRAKLIRRAKGLADRGCGIKTGGV